MYTPEDFEWYPIDNCEGYEVANICGFAPVIGFDYYHIVRTHSGKMDSEKGPLHYALYREETKNVIETFGSWQHIDAHLTKLRWMKEYYYNQPKDPQPFTF